MYFGQKQASLRQTIVEMKTDALVQEVRSKGYIDKDMYDAYIAELSSTGVLYDISMEHTHHSLEPEYRFRTPEEVMEEQDSKFSGENLYTYRPVHSEIPHVEDPIDNSGNLNTETNESILENAVNNPADPNHVHDSYCYSGHKHIGEPMFTHIHQHTTSCREFKDSIFYEYICGSCGVENLRFVASYYWDDVSKSVKLGASNGGTAECMACGSRNLLNRKTLESYNYSCGYAIDINGDGYTDPVGRTQAYEYRKSYPPPKTVNTKETYISGCYRYHEKGYTPVYYNDYYGTPYYRTSAINNFFNYGFSAFCEIPSTIVLKYKYGSSDDSYYSLRFHPNYSNGEFIFSCSGGTHLSIYDNFPTVDFETFRTLAKSSNALYQYLKENASKHISSSGSVSVSEMYGRKVICDEPIHNSWQTICGFEEDYSLDCNNIIVSLTPTHSTQTVYTDDPLITTATALYRDGSTKVVVCTTDFSTSNLVKNQSVTLTYDYLLNGTSHAKTCNITVTVISRNKTCLNGHVYNLNENGSDPGCPFCVSWLKDLQLYYPQSPSITIYRGTTLQENGVTLLATYLDGHTEYVTTDYLDNLDKYYVGRQDVTIGYKGKYVNLTVTTKRNIILCLTCNRNYELYPDDTDPGCPYCAAKIPIFTGNILEYSNKYYEADILKHLYDRNGIYYFSNRDYFNIRVKNRSKGWGRGVLSYVFKGIGDEYIHVIDGGYIREEIKKYR